MDDVVDVRIDKWLWAVRLFKTRAIALEACKAGHVKLDGHAVKPGRPVRIGEIYVVLTSGVTRTVRVVGIAARRVGPKIVPTLLDDLTPPEEYERARLSFVEQILSRAPGSGRPTKRERRQMDRWLP